MFSKVSVAKWTGLIASPPVDSTTGLLCENIKLDFNKGDKEETNNSIINRNIVLLNNASCLHIIWSIIWMRMMSWKDWSEKPHNPHDKTSEDIEFETKTKLLLSRQCVVWWEDLWISTIKSMIDRIALLEYLWKFTNTLWIL